MFILPGQTVRLESDIYVLKYTLPTDISFRVSDC